MEKLRQILIELGFSDFTSVLKPTHFHFNKSIDFNLGKWNFDVYYIKKTNIIRISSHYNSHYNGIQQRKEIKKPFSIKFEDKNYVISLLKEVSGDRYKENM